MADGETKKRWESANRARLAEYSRRYRASAKGKAARANAQRAYRKRHPDRIVDQMAGWMAKNPGYERDRQRRRYAQDPTRQQQANRDWKRRHPEVVREHGRRAATSRRLRKYGGPAPRLTRDDWSAIKAAYDGRCAYCFGITSRPTQEHVIPLSMGGAHARVNVVPACFPCNRSKGTKALRAWLFPERIRCG